MIITKWINYAEAENYEENGFGGLGGFFERGMRWIDYKEGFFIPYHEELEILRKSIIDNKIRCTGSEHQFNYEACPLWDNEKTDTYSMRAWGDLMAAIWSTEENKDYSYMDFYC